MVLQNQSSTERIEESFNQVAREFLDTELCDGGRAIRKRGLLHGGMKIVLSPQESRHEVAIRVLIGQVGALGARMRAIEAKLGMVSETVPAEDPTADDAAPDPTAAEIALVNELEKPVENP